MTFPNESIKKFIESNFDPALAESAGVYPASVHECGGGRVFIADTGDEDMLFALSALGFKGESFSAAGEVWTAGRECHENASRLRELFPFTAPSPVLKKDRTIGLGDRLGIATPGHIRAISKYDVYPVFAQQSIRELTLTERSFDDVLDCVTFAVFRENFTRPFGADGDHLKKFEEIEYALSRGYTMITLDCSEHINDKVAAMSDEEVEAAYVPLPETEEKYLGRTFDVNGMELRFEKNQLMRIIETYNEAIEFAVSVYKNYFAGKTNPPDFEISIDETGTPTTPQQHFYIANELYSAGVSVATIAPRFCGEFQKGIDYIGDLTQFEKELKQHVAIAEHFGYKLSVHSGSDKFSVFPAVGRNLNGRFHVKTAGTNWLEAMAVIAEHCPALYREVHEFALNTAFAEAKKYYHVTTDLSKIPALDTLTDEELPTLFTQNDARQLIHITYGLILTEKNPDGSYRFKDRLYAAWREYSDEYSARLEKHIGRHLEMIYSGMKK